MKSAKFQRVFIGVNPRQVWWAGGVFDEQMFNECPITNPTARCEVRLNCWWRANLAGFGEGNDSVKNQWVALVSEEFRFNQWNNRKRMVECKPNDGLLKWGVRWYSFHQSL